MSDLYFFMHSSTHHKGAQTSHCNYRFLQKMTLKTVINWLITASYGSAPQCQNL